MEVRGGRKTEGAMSLCATKRNLVLTGKNVCPLLNKTRVFARHYQKRTTTYLLVALANIAMDPFPETQGVEEEVEQNKIDGDGEEGNKESEEVEESGARRDEDGDKGVAIGSRYVWTLNCAPKVIQFAFKPDGLTARKAEPEPPSDSGEQLDTILHCLSPRMTIGLEHVCAGPRNSSQCGGLYCQQGYNAGQQMGSQCRHMRQELGRVSSPLCIKLSPTVNTSACTIYGFANK
ncbi:hypothetical protein BC835DRAFT_1447929 [Cytidiella melzeri]|nr:hypothetical protein BC835DRAFT_1447929 [Cytidiella melzeri]